MVSYLNLVGSTLKPIQAGVFFNEQSLFVELALLGDSFLIGCDDLQTHRVAGYVEISEPAIAQ